MLKIIFIISFSPNYAQWEDKPRPEFCWENNSGKWIGIWGFDWGDLMLKALAECYPANEYEVWQPDLRADKEYAAILKSNLMHRNFPARMRKRLYRGKISNEIYSSELVREVMTENMDNTVVMLPTTVRTPWIADIIKAANKTKIIYYNFLNSSLMLPIEIETIHPLKIINRLLINRERLNWLQKIDGLLTTNDNPLAIERLLQLNPNMKVFYFYWGIDIEYWKPYITKEQARKELGLDAGEFILLLSQRLVPVYQIDRFIEVMSRTSTSREFQCYITGHGLKDYEKYLEDLVKNLGLSEKILFMGFLPDDLLRKYMIAADLFVTVPKMFAGSGGAAKALAIGTPVMHVNMGYTYEYLKEQNAGEFVAPKDYGEWEAKLKRIIDGMPVKTVPREEVERAFSWENTANSIYSAVKQMLET